MWEDTIVKEIRDIRRQIETECHNDFTELFNRAGEIQQKYKTRLVSQSKSQSQPQNIGTA